MPHLSQARGPVRRSPIRTTRRVAQVQLDLDVVATVSRTQVLLGSPSSGRQILPLRDRRVLTELMDAAAEPYPWL